MTHFAGDWLVVRDNGDGNASIVREFDRQVDANKFVDEKYRLGTTNLRVVKASEFDS